MGDMADDIAINCALYESCLDDLQSFYRTMVKEQENRRSGEKLSERKWTTANGDIIKIKDMSDSHLQNTINWIKRKLDSVYGVWSETGE